MGSPKQIGTPVRCPKCLHPNLAIDIWCERCRTPLDWKATEEQRAASPMSPAARPAPPASPLASLKDEAHRQYCWSCGAANGPSDYFCGSCGTELGGASNLNRPTHRRRRRGSGWAIPNLALPAVGLPRVRLPRWRPAEWQMPVVSLPRLRVPQLPRTVLVAGLVLALLLIIPLGYLVSGVGRPVASRQAAATHLATTKGSPARAGTPQAVAIAAVQARTGLKYSSSCAGTGACLSITGQTIGQAAAAVVFSTAHTGGRECVSYLVQKNGSWQALGSVVCALPNQVSPLPGRDATVHVPGSCANVHASASLRAGVVTCLGDGSSVHVDGGPTYADGFAWWHTSKGWIAHDFLVAP